MANDKQHGFISRTVGLSLGFLGIVGLVLSLVSLLPVNFYNIFVAVTALTQVLRHENDWWALSSEGTLYAVFLTGAILSSLITIAMVLVTACRQRPHDAQMAAASAAVEHDIEGKRRSSVWLSRMGCLIFVGQISWALFGTHLLFFLGDTSLPATIHKSTMLSVLILWLNYLILTVFAFILFCASFFIILGARRGHPRRPSTTRPPSVVGEEMQYHREETTPLLSNNNTSL
ncbi:hypothetical protein O0I10_002038 [Lichtheimia ornata]|uniref:Transmembrane protein n=1 Tax=Lichtheimia ornata TaxID=688661 RepID=A0AAD7XYX3_9FUNG|nr:uncharacterized protein O0I10_002038 [Lichtheimia ornata]KAJ8662344.1 hypothetical protein O0I10_002038 [Lichtheimia ornata]